MSAGAVLAQACETASDWPFVIGLSVVAVCIAACVIAFFWAISR